MSTRLHDACVFVALFCNANVEQQRVVLEETILHIWKNYILPNHT